MIDTPTKICDVDESTETLSNCQMIRVLEKLTENPPNFQMIRVLKNSNEPTKLPIDPFSGKYTKTLPNWRIIREVEKSTKTKRNG